MQNYFDILLTACYDCNHDLGLEYAWDGVNEMIISLGTLKNPEICVLGQSLKYNGVKIDPGRMELGIINKNQVNQIRDYLFQNNEKIVHMDVPEDLLYDLDEEEIKDSYSDLIEIYDLAIKKDKGILFTF